MRSSSIILLIGCLALHVSMAGQEILPYTSILEHRTMEKWTMVDQRCQDDDGIAMDNKKYNALDICQFGVFNYHEFKRTGDSVYYQACVDQFKYFIDTNKVDVIFDGEAIGLPYDYNWQDLVAPWYSGMTQGYGASYLLRYYDLTGDDRALDVVQKVVKLILIPENEGGILGQGRNGMTWIEEYPKSKKKDAVLNGFINGWIGLYEYCQFFPDDELAKSVLNDCLESLKKTLPLYDTPNWTTYDMGGSTVDNQYLKYQIIEMKHMYELTGDEQFRKQMLLWSTFAFNKPISHKEPGFVNKDYNFSVPTIPDNGTHVPNIMFSNLLSKNRIDTSWFEGNIDPRNATFLLYGGENYPVIDTIQTKKKRSYVFHIEFTDTLLIDLLRFSSTNGIPLGMDYELRYLDLEKDKMRRVKNMEVIGRAESSSIAFGVPIETSCIEIEISIKNYSKGLDLTSIGCYNTTATSVPLYSHHQSEIFEVQDSEFSVTVPNEDTQGLVTFYRYSTNPAQLKNTKWTTENSFEGDSFTLNGQAGHYQFLTVFEINNPDSKLGEITVK